MSRRRTSRKRKVVVDDLVYEKDLQTTIQQAAHLYGYLTYHTYDSKRSEPGFPDLVIVGHGKLFMWELKSQDGVLTTAQIRWLDALRSIDSPPVVDVVIPSDLDGCLHLLKKQSRPG